MTIECLILFTDHVVICNPNPDWDLMFAAEYAQEMSTCLRVGGSMQEHAEMLRDMNNDSTWSIKRL